MPSTKDLLFAIANTLGITGTTLLFFLAASAAAYTLFIFLGKSYLENKFKESFKKYEHKHNVELAELKAKIDMQLERVKKFNDKEFEILPKAWELLLKAEGLMNDAIALVKSYSNLNGSDEKSIRLFLERQDFSEADIEQILSFPDKTKTYIELFERKRAQEAHNSVIEFQNYILIHAIFIDPKFKDRMIDFGQRMKKVTSLWVITLQEKDRSLFKGTEREEASKEIEVLRYEIEKSNF